jgi:hypothetical protein
MRIELSVRLKHPAKAEGDVCHRHDRESCLGAPIVHCGCELREISNTAGRRQHDPGDLTHIDELIVASHISARPNVTLIAEDIVISQYCVAGSDNESDRGPPGRKSASPVPPLITAVQ